MQGILTGPGCVGFSSPRQCCQAPPDFASHCGTYKPLASTSCPVLGRRCLLYRSLPTCKPAYGDRASLELAAAVSSEGSPSEPPATPTGFAKASAFLTSYFPVWVAVACTAAVMHPPLFLWFKKDFVTAGLALTMLAMGTTLSLEDFQNVFAAPGRVMLGALLQYTIMPLMGFVVSRLAGLPTPFAIGICLVASCPGGTASNVVTFLANADVALSVMMTTVSTFAAVVMTPLLTKTLVGAMVPVDAKALFVSTLQVVLVPVILGAALNQFFPRAVKQTAPFAPLVAVIAVVLILGSVMAQNAAAVTLAGPRLVGAIITLHAGGFAFGYGISKLAGLPEKAARTNSIEVGMQNSALGAVLAAVHFSDPLTAVPCALSACLHSLMGSALAAAWRSSDATGEKAETMAVY